LLRGAGGGGDSQNPLVAKTKETLGLERGRDIKMWSLFLG